MKILLLLLSLAFTISAQETRKFGWLGDSGQKRVMMLAPHQWAKTQPDAKSDLTGGLPPVLNQGMLGSCHDDKTEVLTENGWLLFAELTGQESLATVNPETSELFFEKPVALIKKPYSGEMLCMENHSLNFRVTPDHKMLVRKWDERERTLSDKYILVDAKDVGWYFGLMNRVVWRGVERPTEFLLKGVPHKLRSFRNDFEVPISSWLNFLGLYAAEGTMYPKEWSERTNQYRIQIAASKDREVGFARKTFEEIGLSPRHQGDRFHISDKRLYFTMEAMGLIGVKAAQKRIPSFVFGLPAESVAQYLLGHFMGDGCMDNGGVKAHYTSSTLLADDLQRAIFLSGNESRISSRPPRNASMKDGRVVRGRSPEHRVSVCERKGLSVERKCMFSEPYNGMVYCAEVPTFHTLVTRREGKILISGNCVAQGVAAAWSYAHNAQTGDHLPVSRLMIYYEARKAIGTVNEDSGSQIVDAVRWMQRWGSCREPMWPYDISKFRLKAPNAAYGEAKSHRAIQAFKVDNTDRVSIRLALSNGFPVVVGSLVYSGIMQITSRNYTLPMPRSGERPIGGHCYLLVGHDDQTRLYLARNSWGRGWGRSGSFLVPADYIHSGRITEDCWVIVGVSPH